MVKTINAGIIGCDMSEDFFRLSEANKVEQFSWKKIYLAHQSPSTKSHPHTQIVEQAEAILEDADIDLVFVSSQQLHFVKQVIDAGKSVRII